MSNSSTILSSVTSGSPSSSSAPVQTTTPSGGGNGNDGSNNNGGGGGSGGENIANSASLYLYTFLATLVLLLGVSAAIVIRSLLLRRRHRRMIEEAIRNGTYVPPSVLANARGKVDLAKKPRMWEANVYGPSWNSSATTTSGDIGYNGGGKEKDNSIGAVEIDFGWADIFPVAASISATSPAAPGLGGSSSSSSSENNPDSSSSSSSSDATNGSADGSATGPRPTMSTRFRAAGAMPTRAVTGAWRLISPAGRVSRGGHSDPEDSSLPLSTVATGAGAAPHNSQPQQLQHQSLPTLETSQNAPTHVEVAVLIAMPGALAAAEHRAKMVEASGGGECEEDLPHVEVGMAEIVVPPSTVGSVGQDDEKS